LLNADALTSFECLEIDEATRSVQFKPGHWRIDRNIIVPSGYTVVAGPRTRIDLVAGAKIYSQSPVRFLGTKENPIVVESSDSQGQGLIVVGSTDESLLSEVTFSNLGEPKEAGWHASGAVTFYESDVRIRNVRFQKLRAEDALNVVRCRVDLVESVFSDAQSDAFDGDYITGTVANCTFIRCGNDGIDVSGSTLGVTSTELDTIGDKAISAGEGSVVDVKYVVIRRSQIGFASKDLSALQIANSKIVDCPVGITAFQKKPEFGGGRITAQATTIVGSKEEFLIEKGSSMSLDGEPLPATRLAVETILYGNTYGKSSKDK
tara:strand:- start:257 stop:1216 length:960 start_codon:yes stop_codon:yes gene_type:complete